MTIQERNWNESILLEAANKMKTKCSWRSIHLSIDDAVKDLAANCSTVTIYNAEMLILNTIIENTQIDWFKRIIISKFL